jgi:hypothetical protein
MRSIPVRMFMEEDFDLTATLSGRASRATPGGVTVGLLVVRRVRS